MSSISINASGQRGITNTINDPARSAASIQTKQDDDLEVSLGSVREVSVLLADGAKFKRVRTKDGRVLWFVKQGFLLATAYNGGSWPNGTISARKGVPDNVEDVLEEVTWEELLAARGAEEAGQEAETPAQG